MSNRTCDSIRVITYISGFILSPIVFILLSLVFFVDLIQVVMYTVFSGLIGGIIAYIDTIIRGFKLSILSKSIRYSISWSVTSFAYTFLLFTFHYGIDRVNMMSFIIRDTSFAVFSSFLSGGISGFICSFVFCFAVDDGISDYWKNIEQTNRNCVVLRTTLTVFSGVVLGSFIGVYLLRPWVMIGS